MSINQVERKKVIKELQGLAENILNLKAVHRQKRPIVIEFCGSPKAGKTSCINSLELFLKRNGFTVQVIQERASVCPVSDKQSPMFNLWTSCMSLAGLIGTLENKNNSTDVLILDRGLFDALCWFEWLVSTSKMEESQRQKAEQFLLMEELVKPIDIVFAFSVDPKVSIEREYAKLLTDKIGTIMNERVLNEYLVAMRHIIGTKKHHFHSVFEINTSQMTQDDVGKEVTIKTLETLKGLLMESIGYFTLTEEMQNVFADRSMVSYGELSHILPPLEFSLREDVEANARFVQPIPIAVITNKKADKLLVIKKNKNAVSETSPEKDKHLIYVGGHARYEDKTESNARDFLSLCKATLKREIKEEIGISVALGSITPYFIYTNNYTTSMKHLAVCFIVHVDEESIKLRLDSQELVLNKGKSKSGKFLSISDIKHLIMESWSYTILENIFDTVCDQQMTMLWDEVID